MRIAENIPVISIARPDIYIKVRDKLLQATVAKIPFN